MLFRSPGLEDHQPPRSDFSPKRGSKSPGPPKPRSRVRYEDEEKQLRRQRQYTAGGVGSSRSRSSKSSRRSLVSPFCRLADDTLIREYFSIAAREYHWPWNLSPLEVHRSGGEVRGGRQDKTGRMSETIWNGSFYTHLDFVL